MDFLGLEKNEVRLVPFTNDYSKEFKKIKQMIVDSLNISGERIEHIGSTAIINIQAKPILDILLGVDDVEEIPKEIIQKLKEIGFYQLNVERTGEIVFAKFTDKTFTKRTHYIHLVKFKGELWNDLIFFRDYLNSNELAKREYENLKEAIISNNADITMGEYTNRKEDFVKRIINLRRT